jgi:predicted TIM-barrel fold metal-dependent hydrolase
MPEVKQALSNVWFDTAASGFLYTPAIYEQMAGIIGAERILFGTDYPLVSQKRPLGEIGKLDMDSEAKAKILGVNIAGILGLNNG